MMHFRNRWSFHSMRMFRFNGLFWKVLLFIVIGYVVLKIVSNYKHNRNNKSALEILEARFANGEIDEEEFISKRNIILNRKD